MYYLKFWKVFLKSNISLNSKDLLNKWMDGGMDGQTDGRMGRWMVQAIGMCFNALKEVRK